MRVAACFQLCAYFGGPICRFQQHRSVYSDLASRNRSRHFVLRTSNYVEKAENLEGDPGRTKTP